MIFEMSSDFISLKVRLPIIFMKIGAGRSVTWVAIVIGGGKVRSGWPKAKIYRFPFVAGVCADVEVWWGIYGSMGHLLHVYSPARF